MLSENRQTKEFRTARGISGENHKSHLLKPVGIRLELSAPLGVTLPCLNFISRAECHTRLTYTTANLFAVLQHLSLSWLLQFNSTDRSVDIGSDQMGTAMDEIPACLYLQPFACNFKVFYCITNGCRFASYASTLPNWPQFYVISRFSVIMVSLGTDSHYQSVSPRQNENLERQCSFPRITYTCFHNLQRLAGRPPERSADGDTAHLIMETDEVAFWDMASGTNGLSSILVTGEDDSEKFHSIKNIPLVVFIIVLLVRALLSVSGAIS